MIFFFFIKKELAGSMSILTFYWHLITLKHIFCLKIFTLNFDVVSERWEWSHWWASGFAFFKNYEILFTLVRTNQKKLFIYYNFFTKTDQKLFIHLNFRIVFRGIKKNLFPEHLIFLVSDDIKEDHLCRCQISEREKQNSLGTKLVVKYKGSIMWENLAQVNRLSWFAGISTFLKIKLQWTSL